MAGGFAPSSSNVSGGWWLCPGLPAFFMLLSHCPIGKKLFQLLVIETIYQIMSFQFHFPRLKLTWFKIILYRFLSLVANADTGIDLLLDVKKTFEK